MSELRIEVGRATVIAEAVEVRHASDDGVVPIYSVSDLMNATVRCLRAIGTEEAAEAIDRLTAPDGSELEHGGDAPGTFDGIRVPLPLAPEGYVYLSPEALRQAAVMQLEHAVGLPDVLPIVLARGQQLEAVLDHTGPEGVTPPGYLVHRIEAGGLAASDPPGTAVAVLRPAR